MERASCADFFPQLLQALDRDGAGGFQFLGKQGNTQFLDLPAELAKMRIADPAARCFSRRCSYWFHKPAIAAPWRASRSGLPGYFSNRRVIAFK